MKYPEMSKASAFSLFEDADEENKSSQETANVDDVPLHQATPEQLREIIRRREAEKAAGDETGTDEPVHALADY